MGQDMAERYEFGLDTFGDVTVAADGSTTLRSTSAWLSGVPSGPAVTSPKVSSPNS